MFLNLKKEDSFTPGVDQGLGYLISRYVRGYFLDRLLLDNYFSDNFYLKGYF